MTPPKEICRECIEAMEGHWLSAFAIYCLHTRVIAIRTSSTPWKLIRNVAPADAAHCLANAADHFRRTAPQFGVTPEQLDRIMQRAFDRTRLSAREFHARYGWRDESVSTQRS